MGQNSLGIIYHLRHRAVMRLPTVSTIADNHAMDPKHIAKLQPYAKCVDCYGFRARLCSLPALKSNDIIEGGGKLS